MLKTFEEFLDAAQFSTQDFSQWAQTTKPSAIADHLGYKCSSREEFERLRAVLEAHSRFIFQSIISGRRIAIIKLETEIPTLLGAIRFIELSDQKPDGSQVSGFDHVEIFPIAGSVEELAEVLSGRGTLFEKTIRPHHTTYDTALSNGFKVRLEEEALIEKIKREEMK